MIEPLLILLDACRGAQSRINGQTIWNSLPREQWGIVTVIGQHAEPDHSGWLQRAAADGLVEHALYLRHILTPPCAASVKIDYQPSESVS